MIAVTAESFERAVELANQKLAEDYDDPLGFTPHKFYRNLDEIPGLEREEYTRWANVGTVRVKKVTEVLYRKRGNDWNEWVVDIVYDLQRDDLPERVVVHYHEG